MAWQIELSATAARRLARLAKSEARRITVFLRRRLASLDDPGSLSGLGIVGCKSAAAVWLRRASRAPASCPIASAMGRRIRQKLSSPGPILATPHFVSASTPQARQAPGRPSRRGQGLDRPATGSVPALPGRRLPPHPRHSRRHASHPSDRGRKPARGFPLKHSSVDQAP